MHKNQQVDLEVSRQEPANTISHGVGVLIFIIGSWLLLRKAYISGDVWKIWSAYIYGGSLMLMYLASSIYHFTTNPKWKNTMHLVDHSAIFVLIAGTYTPFLLVGLREHIHISFIIVMWSIAIAGIVYKVFMIEKYRLISTFIYLLMGWMVILKIHVFYLYLSEMVVVWIVIGGLFYSIGTIFYIKTKLPYNHTIWHIFVLAGSVSHFIAIYHYVY